MKRSTFKILCGVLLFLGLLPTTTLFAQDYYFRHLTTRSGIVGAYIDEIAQDERGFIWFATNTGLSKFDGYSFTNYRSSSDFNRQLSDNVVTELHFLPGNRLLIGHGKGIDLFSIATETFKALKLAKDLPPITTVFDLQMDEDGDLWVVSDHNLYHFPKPSFDSDTLRGQVYPHPDGEEVDFRDIEFYRGEVWLGTQKGVFIFNAGSKKIRKITSSDPAIQEILNTTNWEIATGPDGNLYLSFLDGVLRYNNSSSQLENITHIFSFTTDELSEVNFQDLFVDSKNRLWIGTNSRGAYRWNMFTDEVTHFAPVSNDENTVNSGDIHYIYEDDQNNMWFGYHFLGVSLMYSQSWNYSFQQAFPDLPDTDPKNNLFKVLMDQQSVIWGSTQIGLIKNLGSESPTYYEFDPDLIESVSESEVFYNMLTIKNGQVFFAVVKGGESAELMSFDIDQEKFTLLDDENVGDPIGVEPLSDGNSLFIGNFNTRQMLKLDTESLSVENFLIPELVDSSSYDFRAIIPDYITDTEVYIKEFMLGQAKTNLGSYIYDRTSKTFRLHEFELEGSIAGTNAPLISNFTPGVTYFNTNSGLIRVDNVNNTSQLLFAEQVPLLREGNLLMVEDSQGYIWLNNQTGFMRLDPQSESISYYEVPPERRPRNPGFSSTLQNGEIFFPGEGGYIRFNPLELQSDQPLGETIITSLQTLSETYPTIYNEPKIEVESDNNSLTFNFIGINFRDPNSTHYRYRILGSENEQWIQVGSQRSVFIPNLPSGDFTFEIQSGSQFGSFNEKSAKIEFSILPPWWNTIPAYALYLLLIGGLTFGVDRVQRKRLLLKERERTREKELKQAREIETAYHDLEKAHEQLKSAQAQLVQQEKLASLGQLTAGIAHEIKNPLNFVNNFSEISIELIEEVKADLEEVRDQLSDTDRKKVNDATDALKDIEANLKKIHEHGFRADRIVKSMLQHSRGGNGDKTPTDLNNLLREYVNLTFHGMRASREPINVDIKLQLEENLPEVPIISEDFSRVIVNLCNNAFDAMRDKLNTYEDKDSTNYKPVLTVRSMSERDRIMIEVEDNGPGISSEMQDKILQPFFTTKKGTEGTGLGLSITNDIVKAHGGEINIQSDGEEGTKFIITLKR